MPPFQEIGPEHFQPAFEEAFASHRREIGRITGDEAAPTFENTIAALERSGLLLSQIVRAFYVLAGAHTNDALEEVERQIAPLLARHRNEIYLDEALFRRVDDLYRRGEVLGLSFEQARLLERYHTEFRRSGAGLQPEAKTRLAEINERLASLGTSFGQNVLADEKSYTLALEGEADLAGLPDFVRAAARGAAEARGLPGKHVITLSRSIIEPFLQFSARRDLREKAFQAGIARGDGGGKTDNKAIIAETIALRAERARLLGYPTFAHYRLEDQMAKTPAAVRELLEAVWPRARAAARRDRDALQEIVRADGSNFAIAPWDWRYYAEKRRQAEFDLDEAEIKPYLQLERLIEAAFDTATRLFGITFTPVANASTYHPDVRLWEVKDPAGNHVALFIGDYFARPSKRSGAWMTALRDRDKVNGDIRPIIVNVMNFSKPEAGEPALLSFDDARTLFHEFGHALHGMLSDVTYPTLAGTRVPSDFVEFPSQIYEHWLEQPQVLGRFAVHCRTGQPMPKALLERLLRARRFNQAFATVEYTACALLDLDLHTLENPSNLDPAQFERTALERIGMPSEIVMRHRLPHFAHVFSGGGYAAGYYSYMWSEVLDADGFQAFAESGDIFDRSTAQRLKDYVLSAGNLREPAEAYRAFRGRLPTIDALMEKRGLAAEPKRSAE
jgi:peptidyl-dipeptidase Dcp